MPAPAQPANRPGIAAHLDQLASTPHQIEFSQVLAVIEAHYSYAPTRFSNGAGTDLVINEAGSNEGSCRVFAFAQLHGLSEPETLALFGSYYRHDVLEHPAGVDHANIRTFMRHGWQGIRFDAAPLTLRET